MNDTIDVPPPIIIKAKTFHDCPTTLLKIKYVGKPTMHTDIYATSPTITTTNTNSFSIAPYKWDKLTFPIIVLSSLPAITIVHASELVYRLGLHSLTTIIPTNNTFLYITIYNPTTEPITFKKDSLPFYCTTILSYQNLIHCPFAITDHELQKSYI